MMNVMCKELDDLKEKNEELLRNLAQMHTITAEERLAMVVTEAVTKSVQPQPKRGKVPPPNPYNGSKETLPIFQTQVIDWLDHLKEDDDDEKIRLTKAYMKEGEAAEWVVMQTREQSEWITFEDFMKDVEARFGDIDPEYTAREKLKKLRQGSSVERYNTDFRKVQAQSGYSETDLMEKYQDGLNEETLQKMYNNRLPTTLKGWMSEAL